MSGYADDDRAVMAARADLALRVYQEAYDYTETFGDDGFGTRLVYLLAAILKGTRCEYSPEEMASDNRYFQFLRETQLRKKLEPYLEVST